MFSMQNLRFYKFISWLLKSFLQLSALENFLLINYNLLFCLSVVLLTETDEISSNISTILIKEVESNLSCIHCCILDAY
jgi:hypothetical protein